MGDSVSDVGFLRMARHPFAPANGSAEARAASEVRLTKRYQRGLLRAVEHAVGHVPGGCPKCARSPLSPGPAAPVDLLSLQENHSGAAAARLAHAAWLTHRSRMAAP